MDPSTTTREDLVPLQPTSAADAADAFAPFAPATAAPPAPGGLAAWLRLLRPRQWVKNSFVLAPLVFSGHLAVTADVLAAAAAFVLFCLLASGIYCWNDAVDAEADRQHPVKRLRPVAAGLIPEAQARLAGVLLATGATALGALVEPWLAATMATYLLLNGVYSRWLKHVVILDVFGLASFFVLRLLAGSAAIRCTLRSGCCSAAACWRSTSASPNVGTNSSCWAAVRHAIGRCSRTTTPSFWTRCR